MKVDERVRTSFALEKVGRVAKALMANIHMAVMMRTATITTDGYLASRREYLQSKQRHQFPK